MQKISPKIAERHGQSRTLTYLSWIRMRQFCLNQQKRYPSTYNVVCERWSLYSSFLEDMGVKPDGKRLGRYDPMAPFDQYNCAWMTTQEAAQCRRYKALMVDDQQYTVPQILQRSGSPVALTTFKSRLRLGWNLHRALWDNHVTMPKEGSPSTKPTTDRIGAIRQVVTLMHRNNM